MTKKVDSLFQILKKTFRDWSASNANQDAMIMAYCAIFSIPGLLIIIIWIAGLFLGEEAIRGEISSQISGILGIEAAKSIEELITNSLIDKESFLMKTIGVISLVFGATTLFFQLQRTINELWKIELKPDKALVKFLIDRSNAFGLILIVSFLLIITMLLSALISYFNEVISTFFGLQTYTILQISSQVFGFIITVSVFMLIFRILPDAKISWKPVLIGATLTTVLFTLGKLGLNYYFAQVKPTSVFGAAATIVLIMLWVNYSCMILFFGAIFTKNYAAAKNLPIRLSSNAEWINGNEQSIK